MNVEETDTIETSFDEKVLLVPGQSYAVTINPENQYHTVRYKSSVVESTRIESFESHIGKLLPQVFNNCGYSFITEISENPIMKKCKGKQEPRLHLHGVVRFASADDIKEFLLYGSIMLAKVSNYAVEPLSDLDKWIAYCSKQSFLGLPTFVNFPVKTPALKHMADLASSAQPRRGRIAVMSDDEGDDAEITTRKKGLFKRRK